MFWWIVGIGIAALIIINAFSKKPAPKQRRPVHGPHSPPSMPRSIAAPNKKGSVPYAMREVDGRDEALSLGDVEALFAPLKREWMDHKRRLAAAVKIAAAYESTCVIRPEDLASIEDLGILTKETAAAAKRLNDELYFIREAASERWHKLFEEIENTHADVEDCLADIEATRQVIADGDYLPPTL